MAFKNVRARLHAANPCCCYCGILTVNRERRGRNRQRPTDATIEHLHSRLTGPLQGRNKVCNLAIACYKCNNERAQREERALSKEQRDKLSIRGKALDSWFAALSRDLDRFEGF